MKKMPCILLLFTFSYPAMSASNLYPVKAVEDGDTLVVVAENQDVRIQLLGIDAPEDVPNPKLQKDLERTKLAEEVLIERVTVE